MEPFVRHAGAAVPFLRPNVDTDVIIPIIRLVSSRPSTWGQYCFESIRYLEDGSDDPNFVLNQAAYRDASILLAGPNFGCGSSREGAVTALMGFGFRCIIAPSFGEIFYNNCFKNGMLPIVLGEGLVQRLAESVSAHPEYEMKVDLEQCSVEWPGLETIAFEIDSQRRSKLLKGLDDIQETLMHMEAIDTFQENDRKLRPWIYDWSKEDA